MTSLPWTLYIKEENHGYVTFETKEDAEAWIEDPESSDIKWNSTETISQELVHEPSTPN